MANAVRWFLALVGILVVAGCADSPGPAPLQVSTSNTGKAETRQGSPTARATRKSSAPVPPPADPITVPKQINACDARTLTGPATVITDYAPAYVYPRVRPDALATFRSGTQLDVADTEGEWILVRFNDQRWGPRSGYVHCSMLAPRRAVTANAEVTSQPAIAAEGQPAAAAANVPAKDSPSSASTTTLESAKPKMSTKKKVAIIAAITGAAIGAAILIKKAKGGGSGQPASSGGGGGGFLLPAAGTVPSGQVELLLFGGSGHRVFLGCVNCGEYDSGSVFNRYGEHGSPYQANSIFNHYGEYGSPYSAYSACNPYATDPPIIVDRQGTAYGRLTLNRYAYPVQDSQLLGWLKGLCQS